MIILGNRELNAGWWWEEGCLKSSFLYNGMNLETLSFGKSQWNNLLIQDLLFTSKLDKRITYSILSSKAMNRTILQTQCSYTSALSIFHDQIQCKVLNEVVAIIPQWLTIEGVQQRMAGSVSNTAAPMGLTSLSKLQTLASKSSLINFPVVCSWKWHTLIKALHLGEKLT